MKSVVTTVLVALCLVLFSAPIYAQRVIVTPSSYSPSGYGVTSYVSSATPGTATAVNIATLPGMIYGLTANAGINTAGVQVFINFFNATSANVTPGTTAAMFSEPMQAGGTSNTLTKATIMPFGEPIAIPFSTALSFNCTTIRNGTIGTQVPCNVNAVTK